MIYTNYFSGYIKQSGLPNLSPDQSSRLFNIIYLEGVLSGMNRIKQRYKGTGEYYRYDNLIFKNDSLLKDITRNLEPDALIREMYLLSKN